MLLLILLAFGPLLSCCPSSCQAGQPPSLQGILVLPFDAPSGDDSSAAVGFGLAATLETLHNKIPTLPETYLAHHLAALGVTPDALLAAYAGEGERRRIPEQTLAAWAKASGRRFLVSGLCRTRDDRLLVAISVFDAVSGAQKTHQLAGTFGSGLVDLKRVWLTLLAQYGVLPREGAAGLLNPETGSQAAFRLHGLALRHWLTFILDRQLGQELRAALAAARQAVAADGRYALALDTLAFILWWENDKEEAERLFVQALEQDPMLMDAWDGRIGLSFAQGREEEARGLARRQADLRADPASGERAAIDGQLAGVAFKEGRLAEQNSAWPEALAWYEKGLALGGQAFSERPSAEAMTCRRSLALAKQALGRNEEALADLRQLLTLSRQADGSCGSPSQATLHQDLGDLLLGQGGVEEALAQYRAALSCREARVGESKRPLAESYGRIAFALMQRADYVEAAALLQQAREILVRELGSDHPESGRIANSLGVLCSKTGKPAEALTWYEQALAVALRQQGPTHDDTAAIHNNMGLALCSQAEYGRALAAFTKALAIHDARGKAAEGEAATVRTNLGLLAYALADFATARSHFEAALAMRLRRLGPESPETADAYHNLAAVQQAQGAPARALANEELALTIRERRLSPHHPDVAESYNALGAMRFRLGEDDAAQALHAKALAITRQALGPWHPATALGQYNLGAVAVARGAFAKAQADFDKALPVAERAGDRELLWRLFREMSRADKGLGRTASAIFWGKQAVNTIQAMRRAGAGLERTLRKSFVADKEAAFRELALLLEGEGRFDEAIRVIDLLKGEEYFDFIRRDQAEAATLGGQLPLGRVEQEWLSGYETVRRQVTAMGRADDPADAADGLASLRAAMERQRAAASTVPQAPSVVDGNDRIAALRGALAAGGAGTVALYYLLAEHEVSILLVTADTQVVRRVAIEAARVQDLVQRFRLRLTSPGSDPRPEAGRLFRILFAPIAGEVAAAGTTRILLATDASLRYLPFAALHDGSGYLAARYAFSQLTPAQPAAAPGQGGRALRVAALGVAAGGEGLTPLPAVAEELDRIVKESAADPLGVLPGVVRLNRACSRAALVAALDQGFPALHLASHFVAQPGTAADSYLLLGDGSHLDLDQIRREGFDLHGVDLLTLSACDTALGQSDGDGREVESLAVLLQRQGAKAVLASLWPVADRGTALFMQTLYASLKQAGTAPSTALRTAQHTLLTGDPALSHPYFWAPFVLLGAWPQ